VPVGVLVIRLSLPSQRLDLGGGRKVSCGWRRYGIRQRPKAQGGDEPEACQGCIEVWRSVKGEVRRPDLPA
jgi:hypothetical protein